MKSNNIQAIHGYKKPKIINGRPSILAPNKLSREFTVQTADTVWVTDITYIRTWQGWLYLAVVLDLFSRRVVGWSMKPTLAREIVLDALMMAVWRRKPASKVLVHSDQGSQYGSVSLGSNQLCHRSCPCQPKHVSAETFFLGLNSACAHF